MIIVVQCPLSDSGSCQQAKKIIANYIILSFITWGAEGMEKCSSLGFVSGPIIVIANKRKYEMDYNGHYTRDFIKIQAQGRHTVGYTLDGHEGGNMLQPQFPWCDMLILCFLLHTWNSDGSNSFCKEARPKWLNFQCHIVCTALANCPCYNAFLCINRCGVHQFAYCSCNMCPIRRDEGAAVPAWSPCKISPYSSKHVVQLAFKSNLFHESSLQVLLLVISDAQSTLCTHLRRAQTPFTHHN